MVKGRMRGGGGWGGGEDIPTVHLFSHFLNTFIGTAPNPEAALLWPILPKEFLEILPAA